MSQPHRAFPCLLTWVLCLLLLPCPARADDVLLPLFIPPVLTPLSQDTDGDGLPDIWERNGYRDGGTFVDLPALGADPRRKDLFVWMDYMVHPTNGSMAPSQSVIDNIKAVFANAPVSNPDGTTGITIHPILKNEVAYAETIGQSGNYTVVWQEVDTRKNASFTAAYAKSFRYMIWGNSYNNGSSSGLARGIPATDFLVTLGRWPTPGGTDWQKLGTFIHELGHCLSLTHGGSDHANYKPNYLSVMSYFFQISGLYKDGHWGEENYPLQFDYQRMATPDLDENNLNENLGLTGAGSVTGYGTRYWYYSGGWYEATSTNAAGAIDWNKNNVIESSVAADINGSGSMTVITSQNNWDNIDYNAGGLLGPSGGVAAQAAADSRPMPDELRHELNLETQEWLTKSRQAPEAVAP